MLVGDIMSKNPLYVAEDDFIIKARQLIRDNHLRGLPVMNDEGHVTGIVTIQDMLKIASTRSNVTVAGFTREVPLITEDCEAEVAAKNLLNERCAILPVVESHEERHLVGVVSPIDIFKSIDPEKMPKKTIAEIMNTNVVTCSPQDLVTRVWNKMLEEDFTGIPVLDEKGETMGIITRFDVLKRGGSRIGRDERVKSKDIMKVEKLMHTPLYNLRPEDSLHHAADIMSKRDIGRISVVDDDKLIGIVDRYDLIKAFLGEDE